ncbi:MAG TPA: hypothetical protein VFU76_11520 [Terriglobales bacterium]|nr:hypothetical protein [Terriglobales bacterium]
MATDSNRLQPTTVRLPRRLYDEARAAIQRGATEATSLNELLIDSLEEKLRQLRREKIDAEFAAMRNDHPYRKAATGLAEEFAASDGEAFRRGEGERR